MRKGVFGFREYRKKYRNSVLMGIPIQVKLYKTREHISFIKTRVATLHLLSMKLMDTFNTRLIHASDLPY
jgi:hypothetical protein